MSFHAGREGEYMEMTLTSAEREVLLEIPEGTPSRAVQRDFPNGSPRVQVGLEEQRKAS